MSTPNIPLVVANDASVRAFKQGYALGREAGLAEAEVQMDCLQLLADHWYYIANNPNAVAEQRAHELSFIELREERERRITESRKLDQEEEMTFDLARAMIDKGHSDREVAVALGLFLPLVANLRSGAL